MGPGSHPILVGLDVQERRLAAQLFEEGSFCRMFSCGRRRLCIGSPLQSNADIRSLDARLVAEEVPKRDSFVNLVSRIWIIVYCFDAIVKRGKRLFDALASKPRRFATRYKITCFRDSPLSGTTRRFYVALQL